jgi:O-methyltransferase
LVPGALASNAPTIATDAMLIYETGNARLEYYDISDEFFVSLIHKVNPHTVPFASGVEAPWALYQSIEYIVRHGIPGDIVECGVWSGGSMLLAAHALLHFGDTSRRIWLYDTFTGVPKPEAVDARWDGVPVLPTWEHHNKTGGRWAYGGTQEHVREVVCSSGYPVDQFVFVEGMVEETLQATRPESISLLRLDTDLYRSTYLELVHLYPMISAGGILLLDDYGGFQGVRVAVDQYFDETRQPIFLSRINAGVRLAVKLPSGV